MNSKKRITIIMLLLLVLAIPVRVSAVEAVTAEIPFTVEGASGTVILEAVDGAPMPERAIFEGVAEGKFLLSFDVPGDHCYKIYQKSGDEADVVYDGNVYSVCVSVFVKDDGELYSMVTVNMEGSSQKADDIVFENTPKPSTPVFPDTPQTGDDGHLGLWIALMFASLSGLTGCLFVWKKGGLKHQGKQL